MSSGSTAHGARALTTSAEGTRITLFLKEPFATAHTTGSSRSARRPAVCWALSATSSPRTAVVFWVATLVSAATSSSTVAMSSSKASRLNAMVATARGYRQGSPIDPAPAGAAYLWFGRGGKEADLGGLQVVHRPGDLDHALGLERRDDGAAAVDLGHRELDILPGDRVDEGVVLRGALALI